MTRSSRFARDAFAAIPLGGALALGGGLAMINGAPIDRAGFDPAPVVPLPAQAPARLIVDAPLADQLALGRVVVRYRTENLRIMPVFGQAATDLSPRVGHLHLTVDGGSWRWVDSSGEPIIINKLPPGPHEILIELADPTHKVITGTTVRFEVPQRPAPQR